ncbi:hypothetical protein INT48_009192 [Thamnidium elegans]|uniref:Uncharacterized protein n=1 Tax=Thamnidium elegans TaxID=101142 RepID=A0A8H7SLE6_9FUNG|nr:hypothetical protein INT48_009192 [Thamnidium elegans]
MLFQTDFRCINTTPPSEYWSYSAIESSFQQVVVNSNSLKYKISMTVNYDKRKNKNECLPPTHKRIMIDYDDSLHDIGLEKSLFSHLKTKTVNSLHNFNDYDEKEAYYATITMNNVLDLSCFADNKQLAELTDDQIDELKLNMLTS